MPEEFDVVFMDVLMPGIDGIETTRRLKQACGEIFVPVIFVTGTGDEQRMARAIDAGGDDFLTGGTVYANGSSRPASPWASSPTPNSATRCVRSRSNAASAWSWRATG